MKTTSLRTRGPSAYALAITVATAPIAAPAATATLAGATASAAPITQTADPTLAAAAKSISAANIRADVEKLSKLELGATVVFLTVPTPER